MNKFATDPTFRDTCARLAGGPASFASVWSVIGPAIVSDRTPTVAEYEKLNHLIDSEVRGRHEANASLNAPAIHTGAPQIAGPVGVGQESTIDTATLPAENVTDHDAKGDTTAENATTSAPLGNDTDVEAVQTKAV